ncbi:MAG TPA: metallophosphoesterase [Opitutaceae bacterium]
MNAPAKSPSHIVRQTRRSLAALGFLVAASVFAQVGPEPAAMPVTVDASKGEFCLIVVPDTQRYAAYFPEIFRAQFRWIRDNATSLNVKFVVHVGDIVEEGEDHEWIVADESFAMLDGVVPYLAVPGNHDLVRGSGVTGPRNTSKFNAVFSPKRFAGSKWYGGHKGVTSDNSFAYFTAGGQQFMVLGLEYGPTDETLAWADHLVSNHEDNHKVIVVTHCYMNHDDTRLGEGDKYNPRGACPEWNDGEGIWEKFVSRRKNVVMVLSGHVKDDGTGLLISKADEDMPVLQMLANYQFLEHGGQGWLRILKFSPDQKHLEVFTYSPWLGTTRDEPDQQFAIDVPWMFP